MNTFYFEMTDTFGGQTNYSWLHRFTIEAKSLRGALQKLSKETGFNFRYDGLMYKAKRACVTAYLYHDGMETPDSDWIEKSVKLGVQS